VEENGHGLFEGTVLLGRLRKTLKIILVRIACFWLGIQCRYLSNARHTSSL
jgi:hypothetical protein